MPLLIDSHTHLDNFPPSEMPDILRRAKAAGVGVIVAAGTTLSSSQACVELSRQYETLHAGIGLHPMNLEGPLDNVTFGELKKLAIENNKVICISEVGLDFLPTSPHWQIQLQALKCQIRLARELDKPIIFHSRESHREVLQTLREETASEVGGVMHYFQADADTAKEAMDMGFYISLAKPLIRLTELQEVVKDIPLERIVLETDSAPQPWKKYRKNWTEPFHIRQVAEKLAELKGLPVEKIIEQTTANISGLLKLSPTFLVKPPPDNS